MPMRSKFDLRKEYKQKRAELTNDAIEEMSLAIANKLLEIPIWNAHYYHLFLPITAQKEVNTEYVLHVLSGKDKEIVLSKSDFSTRQLRNILLTDSTRITINQYGIPEPQDGLEVPSEKIDVVFVPLLAFDQSGHRIGYGKGFYDIFLAQCSPKTVKIGLSFFEAENALSDLHSGDIALDYCITPQNVYKFK